MQLYPKNLTYDIIKKDLIDIFENKQSGKIVRYTYFFRYDKDYIIQCFKEFFGIVDNYDNIHELLYNAYNPTVIKYCDVCGKFLDFSKKHKCYEKGLHHKVCRKECMTTHFKDYNDLISINNKFRCSSDINNLSKRKDIIDMIEKFKLDYPKFSNYLNQDIVYLWVIEDSLDDIVNKTPLCRCGKLCKPIFSCCNLSEWDKVYFSKSCYDKKCISLAMYDTLTNSVLKKYGTTNVSKLQEIKDKKVDTVLKHYGTTNVMYVEQIKNKIKSTMINRYNVDNISKLDSIKEKKKSTILAHYGSFKNVVNITFGEYCRRMGVTNASQLDFVKAKKIETFMKHYGFDNCFRDPDIKDYIQEYWKNNQEKRKEAHELATKNMMIHKQCINTPYKMLTGINEFYCLNELSQYINCEILRQVRCNRFIVDGYLPDYNIVLEYDEPFHYIEDVKNNDAIRQSIIEHEIDCVVIRIDEIRWFEDKETYLQELKQLIQPRYGVYDIELSKTKNNSYTVKKRNNNENQINT